MVESQKLIRLFLFQDTIVKPVHFLESIFKQCQTLEHFVFQGYSIIHFSHYLDYTEEQQKTKYPNIKYILIELILVIEFTKAIKSKKYLKSSRIIWPANQTWESQFRLITLGARTISSLKADDQEDISNFFFYFPVPIILAKLSYHFLDWTKDVP